MVAYLARRASVRGSFITLKIKRLKHGGQGVLSGVAEPLMPQIASGGGAERELWRQSERVEGAGAFTSESHRLGGKILDRETVRIKLNRNIVISSELTNGD